MKSKKIVIITLIFFIFTNLLFGSNINAESLNNASLTLNITNIPAEANKLVAVIDQGGINSRVELDHDGSGSIHDTLNIPAGGPYRVRVIAFTDGMTFPAILAGGKESDISIADGEQKDVAISLQAPKISVDKSTPSQVIALSKFTIKMNITDPADFLGSSGRLWWNTAYPAGNLYGINSLGKITQISDGEYQFSIDLTAPATPCKVYYQFGEANSSFESPSGDEAPFLVLPNYEKGEQPYTIDVVNSDTVINLNVTNIPAEANKIIAVIDQGGINSRVELDHDGSGSIHDMLSIPAGGPYRVRVIAFTDGKTLPAILAGGKESDVNIADGEQKDVAINLQAPKISLDESTPSQVNASSKFTIKMNITDPADFLGSFGRLWWNTAYPAGNLYGEQPSGKITQISDGEYQFSIDLTAPAAPCKIYYQFGEENGSFDSPYGDQSPFLVLPNYEKGEQPYTIKVVRNCDVNNDGIINIEDIAKIAQHYNENNTDLTWDENIDINGDNLIDIYDLVIASKYLS